MLNFVLSSLCCFFDALRKCVVVCIALITVISLPAYAQINITGLWTVDVLVNSTLNRTETWVLYQQDTTVVGGGFTGTDSWTITGQVNGDQMIHQQTYLQMSHTVDVTVTIAGDSQTMNGTFIDSNGQSGTIQARRDIRGVTLTPTTVITIPPVVAVNDNDVTVTLMDFSKAVAKSKRRLAAKLPPTKKKLTVQYRVTLTSTTTGTSRRRTSKRNVVAFNNLAVGSYLVTYKATALSAGKKVYNTNESPAAVFMVGS